MQNHNIITGKPNREVDAPQVYYHGQAVAALTNKEQEDALAPGDLSKIQSKAVTKDQVQQALSSCSAGSELALPQETTAQRAVCDPTQEYVGLRDVET